MITTWLSLDLLYRGKAFGQC